jgi:hypothetical protein
MLHVEPRFPKRRKWPWRVLWGMLAIVTAAGGYWWWSFATARADRDAVVAEIRARGEPLYWNELADKLLAERSSETGAELFMKALAALGGEYNKFGPKVPSTALTVDLEKVQFVPKIRPVVQRELALGAAALPLLEEAVKRPPGLLTTAIRTDDPISIMLPHIQDSRSLARFLHWLANDALARGDSKTAYHAVELSFLASEQLFKEPFLISQLVRLAMRGTACETLTMCLAHAAPTDAEFAAIDRLLAAADDGFGAESAWQSERAMWMTVLENPTVLKQFFNNFGTGRSGNEFQLFMRERWMDILASPVGSPVMLKTQSAFLRLHDQVAKTTDKPGSDREARKAAYERFDRDAPLTRAGFDLGDWGFRSLNTFDDACAKAHRRNILARLALRLRRHFDKHGRFPEKLEELCDADMPRLRLDWFLDKPIVYFSTKSGFRLEVPTELLSTVDLERKKRNPKETPDLVIEVELKGKSQ